MLTDELRRFLAQPNPAVMATLAKDGRPVTVATWYLFEADGEHADEILLGLDAGRARLSHLRRDPRVALTVLDADGWYSHVSVQGRVGPIEDDVELAQIDRLARHYTGSAYPNRSRPRVMTWLTVDRIHTWGPAFTDD